MTKDHAYLYLGSVSEARRQNELALWRASHLENIACKQAIEEAIRRGFDGMHLSHDCARGVIEDFCTITPQYPEPSTPCRISPVSLSGMTATSVCTSVTVM